LAIPDVRENRLTVEAKSGRALLTRPPNFRNDTVHPDDILPIGPISATIT
jgi:hypothetical protein